MQAVEVTNSILIKSIEDKSLFFYARMMALLSLDSLKLTTTDPFSQESVPLWYKKIPYIGFVTGEEQQKELDEAESIVSRFLR